jgi:ribokinase
MTALVVVGGLDMDLHLFGLRPSGGQAPRLADRYLAQLARKGANVSRAVEHLGVPFPSARGGLRRSFR